VEQFGGLDWFSKTFCQLSRFRRADFDQPKAQGVQFARLQEYAPTGCQRTDEFLQAERAETSDARNKIFELVMASLFRAANFPVKFVEPADAVADVFNIRCFLECKRIQNEKRLQERIQEASSQIETRLRNQTSNKPRGLIAVDISKAESNGEILLVCQKRPCQKGTQDSRLNTSISDDAPLADQVDPILVSRFMSGRDTSASRKPAP
jgi:hypothetical protein